MFTRTREKVSLVIPLADFFLQASKLFLVPFLALIFATGSLTSFLRLATSPDLSLGILLGGALLLGAYILLLQLPVAGRFADKAIAFAKRHVFLSCNWISEAWLGHGQGYVCWLIPRDFKSPIFPYATQQKIVENLIECLREETSGRTNFALVEGASGVGKTKTAFLLIIALLKHPKLFPLADRTYFYDFAKDVAAQRLFCEKLDKTSHTGAVVIVDNLHRASPETIRYITHKLLDTPGGTTEAFVLFLAQPGYAWNLNATADVRLVSEAAERKHRFVLEGMPRSILEAQIRGREGSGGLEQVLARNESGGVASVTQLHFGQVLARAQGRDRLESGLLFGIIHGQILPTGTKARSHIRCLAVATALSLYRGTFHLAEFWRAVSQRRPTSSRFEVLRDALATVMVLRLMTRIGFTPRLSFGGRPFILHEAVAQEIKDTLQDQEYFRECFEVAAKWRLKRGEERHNGTIRWLFACELGDVAGMGECFEASLLSGNLHHMSRCLDRNWERLSDHPLVRFQYAYLLDKIGRFQESKTIYQELRNDRAIETSLLDRVDLARVEAFHGKQANWVLRRISRSEVLANRVAAEYWLVHMDGHRGLFRPDALHSLAIDLAEGYAERDFGRSHFLLYTAARIYFDAHRQAYLVGDSVQEQLKVLDRLPLRSILQRFLPQYRAFEILYRQAHLLANVILPDFAIHNRRPSNDQALALISKRSLDTSLIDIVEAAIRAYRRARDEFLVYGDREHLYLQANILDLWLQHPDVELENYRTDLVDYRKFIEKAGFTEIKSYPRLYFARWEIARYFKALLGNVGGGFPSLRASHVDETMAHLRAALRCDQICGNLYGQLRSEFLLGMLGGLRARDPRALRESLVRFKSWAEVLGYRQFEGIAVELLSRTFLSPLDLRQLFLFSPFVHQ